MNRREALKLLSALPMIKSVEVANVAPNDVIVVECAGRVSMAQIAHIKQGMSQIWPNRKIVVLDGGLSIRVMREA